MVKGETTKHIALGAALIEFGIAMMLLGGFDPAAGMQYGFTIPWVQQAGINFSIAVDGITMLMVLLTTFLVPLIILSSFNHPYRNPSAFYALILFMQTGLLGVFMAMDGFVFYLFWELALIPIYFIAGIWGGERRIAITFKFFVYTIIGSLFMLVGILYLYFQTPGDHSSAIADLYAVRLSMFDQRWVFWFLFIAFAIKMPVFPFHTWQPDTYTESPAPATMLLSGIMLKMGIYGVIRWLLPLVPLGAQAYAPVVLVLSIIGIVYASIIALRQRDMKRLLAYSSIAHVGLISAGLFTFTIQGLQGSMIQMLSHGINVVGLFFVIDIIFKRTQTRQLDQLGGITQTTPVLSVFFMILLLGSVALPLTNGFVGEFLLLNGLFQYNAWMAGIAGLTIILGAVYMLRMFQGSMLGERTGFTEGLRDVTATEVGVLAPLAIMVLWIGIFPNTFLEISEPAINGLLTQIMNQMQTASLK